MLKPQQNRAPEMFTLRYALVGVTAGTGFIILAILLHYFAQPGPISFWSCTASLLRNPLFYLISTAPVILGLLMLFIGRSKSANQRLLQDSSTLVTAFERFYPRRFITLLKKEDVRQVKAGDHANLEMTILFSDIQGFTGLSEQMEPTQIFAILRDYLEWVSPIFQKHNGFIDKYIGDSIMAIFPDSPADAVRAAGELTQSLYSYNTMAEEMNRPPIQIGVGIHTGPLSIGTVGGGGRLSTTVLGDVVNLAARLEGLTRKFHVSVIITDEVQKALAEQEQDLSREIAVVRVKGRRQRITIYEYFGGESSDLQETKKATRGDFLRALYMHRGKEHLDALKLFEQIHIKSPQDPVPVFYIEKCKASSIEIQSTHTKAIKVLLIDDNPAIVDLIRHFLRDHNYRLDSADTGQRALSSIAQFNPDIILLDYNLPDMNGLELLDQLQARFTSPDLAPRAIAFTADLDAGQNLLRHGAWSILEKPVHKTRLLSMLERASLSAVQTRPDQT
ncbi:MAG: response regulator [Leptospiraceae bacterium]|nr:response regulator [Leptospiraceae bacterium]